jgi:deoxycytidylate deaminase
MSVLHHIPKHLLSKITLVVVRIDVSGENYVESLPCSVCSESITKRRLKVYYSI